MLCFEFGSGTNDSIRGLEERSWLAGVGVGVGLVFKEAKCSEPVKII